MIALVAIALVCPDVALECLAGHDESISTWSQLDEAGALEWEIDALHVISRDERSKGRFDVVQTDCGSAGLIHRRPRGRIDGYGFGLRSRRDCPVNDPLWRDQVQARLYHDWANHNGLATLTAWRRVVASPLRAAWRAKGSTRILTIAAAMANSSPGQAMRIGYQTRWRERAMIAQYYNARPTPHRARRVAMLRERL